jgi:two-component system, OmpR family, phosphate regulon sensor histidine kinase PhoR
MNKPSANDIAIGYMKNWLNKYFFKKRQTLFLRGLGGRALILFSMLLLAAFQIFWLHKEYREQESILQKETDILFKNTIQALEDSVIQSKIAWAQKTQKGALPITAQFKPVGYQPSKPLPHQTSPQKQISAIMVRPSRDFRISVKDSVSMQYFNADSLLALSPEKIMSNGNKEVRIMAIYSNNPQQDTLKSLRQSISFTLKPDSKTSDSVQKIVVGKLLKVVGNMTAQAQLQLMDSAAQSNPKKWSYSIKSTDHFSKDCVFVTRKTNPALIINTTNTKNDTTQNIVVRFFEDSLRIKDIKWAYQKQIARAKIDLLFEVVRQKNNSSNLSKAQSDWPLGVHTTPVSSTMPVGSSYVAIFPDYQGYLFKKIVPQSLFSLFLLAITGLAFATIYRNLLQQRRLTQLKNDFISNVTHELKTPIATVGVAIEALQNFGVTSNPTQTQEYLAISQNELNRLSLLVDKVLKMATFEEQGLMLNKEAVNLYELVNQVLGSMKLQFDKHQSSVSLSYLGEKEDREFFSADKIHLTNVVYNLLDNALKYSHKNPKIGVEITENEQEITLSVSDNGMGIAPEYQDKIFEKFFRVPTGDTHDVKGHGLGLNYVASVVKQHGGKIEVESELGKGSRFIVTLPKNL